LTKVITVNEQTVHIRVVRQALKEWGRNNFRVYPWRRTSDPYRVLISEVMLHRTQAKQVLPIYEDFIQNYPNVVELSKATKEDLHDSLYSLGLRWRIDLIYAMARVLNEDFNGQIPMSKEDLLSLPGISEYIAGAVRCFAWNLPEPILDTNTVRVIGRMFGLEIKDSSRRNRQFRDLIAALVDPDEPRAYNYALLDLADKVCMKKQLPDCLRCPVLEWCRFGRIVNESI
jgi:A/G-specific adenine glycosylase